MSTNESPPPPRRGIVRLALVAALGAGAVIGVQALTGGSGGNGARTVGTTGASAAVAAGAPGAAAAGGAAAGDHAPGAAGPAGAAAAGAARHPGIVTGPRLTLVFDAPAAPLAEQNRLIAQGATVALAALNASGGPGHHRVRMLTEPLDGLTPAAVQGRLRAAGPAAVLVLPCDTNSQFTLAAGAARYRTLMLAPCDANAALAQTIPTYWPVGTAGNDEAAGLAGVMARIGYARVFVLDTPSLTYAATMTRYFQAAVQAKQIRVTGEASIPLSPSAAQIAHLAAAIKATAPRTTAVFSALPPPYFNQVAKRLVHDGVHQTLLGTSTLDTPLTLKAGTKALENATFPSYGFLFPSAATDLFVSDYRSRFGAPIGSFPGLGFETIRLLDAAVRKAGSTNPAAIQAAFASGITLTGVALADRSIKAGVDHNPVNVVSVEKITSGSFLPLLSGVPTDVPKA